MAAPLHKNAHFAAVNTSKADNR